MQETQSVHMGTAETAWVRFRKLTLTFGAAGKGKNFH
jgi:hypothetical protein